MLLNLYNKYNKMCIIIITKVVVRNQGYSDRFSRVAQHGANARDAQHDGVVSYQRTKHSINAAYTEQRPGAQVQHSVVPSLQVWTVGQDSA